jgi:hypothetical protein
MDAIDSEAVVTPREELIDSFEPAPLPPAAPDGGPDLEPAPFFLPVIAETQCDQGPCRHRHLLLTAMDAAQPQDGSALERPRLDERGEPIVKYVEDDGTDIGRPIFETEPWTPLQKHRYCYPSPGVRIELDSEEPVSECSRWDPEDPTDPETAAREARRAAYRARERDGDASLFDVEDLNDAPDPTPADPPPEPAAPLEGGRRYRR